jgi:hypothetical protein
MVISLLAFGCGDKTQPSGDPSGGLPTKQVQEGAPTYILQRLPTGLEILLIPPEDCPPKALLRLSSAELGVIQEHDVAQGNALAKLPLDSSGPFQLELVVQGKVHSTTKILP